MSQISLRGITNFQLEQMKVKFRSSAGIEPAILRLPVEWFDHIIDEAMCLLLPRERKNKRYKNLIHHAKGVIESKTIFSTHTWRFYSFYFIQIKREENKNPNVHRVSSCKIECTVRH